MNRTTRPSRSIDHLISLNTHLSNRVRDLNAQVQRLTADVARHRSREVHLSAQLRRKRRAATAQPLLALNSWASDGGWTFPPLPHLTADHIPYDPGLGDHYSYLQPHESFSYHPSFSHSEFSIVHDDPVARVQHSTTGNGRSYEDDVVFLTLPTRVPRTATGSSSSVPEPRGRSQGTVQCVIPRGRESEALRLARVTDLPVIREERTGVGRRVAEMITQPQPQPRPQPQPPVAESSIREPHNEPNRLKLPSRIPNLPKKTARRLRLTDPSIVGVTREVVPVDRPPTGSMLTRVMNDPRKKYAVRYFRGSIQPPNVFSPGSTLPHPYLLPATPDDLPNSTVHDLTPFISRGGDVLVGHGGYGDVYASELSRGEEKYKVAIKVLRSHIYNEANRSKIDKRLRREIRVWACLRHPNVLPLLGTISGFGNHTAMVCPWMEDGNLSQYLQKYRSTLTLADRLKILSQAADGVSYLHSLSVAHGDINCSNVLVHQGRVCITDFGLSTIINEFEGTSYASSTVSDAIRFAAPELHRPDDVRPVLTTSADVYSFGSFMLQVITGRIPYDNLSRFQVYVELSQGRNPRRPPESLLTDEYWDLISLCWQEAEARPDIGEVREALRELGSKCAPDLLESVLAPEDEEENATGEESLGAAMAAVVLGEDSERVLERIAGNVRGL